MVPGDVSPIPEMAGVARSTIFSQTPPPQLQKKDLVVAGLFEIAKWGMMHKPSQLLFILLQ